MGAPSAIVVMGVAGCGKSTVAALLAQRLGWDFAEADRFHSPANVAKMRAGTALSDEDRWPWLDAMAAHLEAERRAGRHCVLACSALRRAYRERLARGHEDVRFVFLEGDFATIESRMARRTGHYMPASLLASQFATLEPPGTDENALTLPVEATPAELVDGIVARLGLG